MEDLTELLICEKDGSVVWQKLKNIKHKGTKHWLNTGLINISMCCICSLASVLSLSDINNIYDILE